MWREMEELRRLGVGVTLFSTRRPPARNRARHAFADDAEAATVYLWPSRAGRIVAAFAWAATNSTLGLLKAAATAIRMSEKQRYGQWKGIWLLVPAVVLAREAKRRGVEMLHLQSAANTATIAMLAEQIARIPYSVTVNADLGTWGGFLGKKLSGARFVVVHSKWIEKQIADRFPQLPVGHVVRAPVGVDTRSWAPRAGGNSGSGWKLVTVGRLHHQKGHRTVIDAVSILAARGYDPRLEVVGGGPELEALQAHAVAAGVADRVHFAGSLPEGGVLSALHGADLFVLATEAEALGVVFMEAMAAGVPVIGTNVGGVGEVVQDGLTGVVVEPKDSHGLAEAIEGLMNDERARRELAARGREFICQHFDSRIGAARLAERMRAACDARQPSRAAALE
jgi:glycosyltransferase involved in cell wall biosynthesis